MKMLNFTYGTNGITEDPVAMQAKASKTGYLHHRSLR